MSEEEGKVKCVRTYFPASWLMPPATLRWLHRSCGEGIGSFGKFALKKRQGQSGSPFVLSNVFLMLAFYS